MAVSIPSLSSDFASSKHALTSPSLLPRVKRIPSTIVAMADKKVNRYDPNWQKQWYGAGLFAEGSEDVAVNIVKKIEKKKVLSSVEKAGLLTKVEDLGFTLSSIERLGVLSKAEEFGLLGLVERAAGSSPALLASGSLPLAVLAIAAIVVIPDDSATLIVIQTFISGLLGLAAAGLFVGSVLLGGLQESD